MSDPEPPECPKGHGPMEPRKAETREQQFCGIWFQCPPGQPGFSCTSAALIPSPELLAHQAATGA